MDGAPAPAGPATNKAGLQGLLRVMTRRLTVMKLVFISSGEPLNYNFAGFRGWSIGFALESTGCKGKGDGRGFRGE